MLSSLKFQLKKDSILKDATVKSLDAGKSIVNASRVVFPAQVYVSVKGALIVMKEEKNRKRLLKR